MIKLSVLYPTGEGKDYDIDYYCNTHVPLVSKLLGKAIKSATIEKGIHGMDSDSQPPYAAMGNLYFESLDAYENPFKANIEKIAADLPNFTNIEPVVQVSEVLI